jgi:hypothetical protein
MRLSSLKPGLKHISRDLDIESESQIKKIPASRRTLHEAGQALTALFVAFGTAVIGGSLVAWTSTPTPDVRHRDRNGQR